MAQSDDFFPHDDLRAALARERNRYFTGRFLTADDFDVEQNYFLSRLRASLRLSVGWGIVSGLTVAAVVDGSDADHVVVGPGLAVDTLGRFLVAGHEMRISLAMRNPGEAGGDRMVALIARMEEHGAQPSPVLAGGGADAAKGEAFGRIREKMLVKALRLDAAATLPADVLVLAVVVISDGARPRIRIDSSRRRVVQFDPVAITGINWTHAGSAPAAALLEQGIEVRFGRPVGGADGVEADGGILRLTVCGADGVLRRLPAAPGYPRWDAAGSALRMKVAGHARLEPGDTVQIKLLCDFLTDAHGQAVSGRFIGGQLPTGAGGPGGAFESWFIIAAPAAAPAETHQPPVPGATA